MAVLTETQNRSDVNEFGRGECFVHQAILKAAFIARASA